MNTNKLYHIRKEIATGFAELCGAGLLFGEVLIFWEILHAMATGEPVHAWVRAALIAAAAAVITAVSAHIMRRRPRVMRRQCRVGVIDAQTICRILEGSR